MRLRFVLASVVLVVVVAGLWGQGSPRVTSVEPATAKIGASVTVHGENLGKGNVAAVFVSNSSDDFPATVVEQTEGKLVIKIPKVKAGDYNISIQVKSDILIQPIRLAVSE
jgi:hypothetical protein